MDVPARAARPGGVRGVFSGLASFTRNVFGSARTFYEAAAPTAKIQPVVDTGPNGANGEIEKIRIRSHYMYANNGFYKQTIRQVANNVVGYTQQSPSKNWIRDGVERNAIDQLTGYWLYQMHPKDWQGIGNVSLTPSFVPAADVVHMFVPERPTSERGVPWAAPVMNTIEMLKDYNRSELEKKQHQSKFTVFYRRPIDEEEGFNGDGDDEPNFQAAAPGMAIEVPEGYDVTFPQQPQVDSNYEPFSRFNLSEVAVCIGLCVEQITLDFKNVNDRVYRAMMLEVGRFILSIQYHMVVSQFCDRVWKRFVARAISDGAWTPPKDAEPSDYMKIEWMPPATGHIHPVQEVTAFMAAVQNGFKSRQQVAAEYGYDIDEIDEQNARDARRAELLRVKYPVYEGASEMPDTPESDQIAAMEKKAVLNALMKMVEAEAA